MKNIAFGMTDMVMGGCENVFIRTLEYLKNDPDLNIEVYFNTNLSSEYYKAWFKQHPEIHVKTIYPLLNIFEKFKSNIFIIENIRKIIFSLYKKFKRYQFKFNKIDVFIDYKNFSFFKEIKHINVPKITWVHGSINFFQDIGGIYYMDKYDKVVVLSDDFIRCFEQLYPNQSEKLIRIYNPINIESIKEMAKNAETLHGKYFCCVCRLDPPKDLETVINAFDDFWQKEGKPDIKLVIVGDGILKKKIFKLANSKACKSKIIFTGTKLNPFGIMQGAMAHILSTTSEGLPTVLIEAAALNVLNIASDCKNAVSEILLNGDAGLLFNPGDVDKLSEIMSDIYNQRIDTKKLIDNAYKFMMRFDYKNVMPQIKQLIKDEANDS